MDAGGYDIALRTQPAASRPSRVAVVLVDDESLRELGRWPWPWSVHADFVQSLNRTYRPAAVIFDVLFAEPDPRDTEGRFARAIRAGGNVYLAAFFRERGQDREPPAGLPWAPAEYVGDGQWAGKRYAGVDIPAPALARAAAGLGPVNVVPELDGCIRRVPLVLDYRGKPYPSLVVTGVAGVLNASNRPLRAALGRRLEIGDRRPPIDEAGETLLYYQLGVASTTYLPHYRYTSVLRGDVPVGELRDKLVVVGFGAAGMGDVHPTPLSPSTLGADISGQMLDALLEGRFMHAAGWPIRLGVSLVVGVLIAFLAAVFHLARSLVLGLLVALGTAASAMWLLWERGLWVPIGAPGVAALCAYSLMLAQRHRESEYRGLRTRMSVHTLAQATRVLSSVRRREELLAEVRSQILEVMEARQANLYLVDAARQELRLVRAPSDQGQPTAHPLADGTLGWVARTGDGHLIQRVAPRSEVAAELGRVTEFPVGSVAYAPLRMRGEVTGVVEVLRGTSDPPFGPDHLPLLSALADEVGAALENAALSEQLAGRVEIANRQLVEAYAELRRERDRVAAIVSNMADGVLLTDAEGRIVFANAAAAAMFGLQVDQLEGRPAAEALPYPPLLAQLGAQPEGAGGRARAGEAGVPMIRLEQPRKSVISPRTVHLVGEQGEAAGAVTVLTDVTLLQELSEMKTEFVSLVSHELRSPLTAIMGFAQTLRGGSGRIAPGDQEEYLGIIEQESYRLVVMINDLLDVSRMDAGRPLSMSHSQVDLKEVAEHVVRFQQLTTASHEFRLAFPEGGLQVEADRDKVVQILTNLISNAIKYSPRGGWVEVGGEDRGEEVELWVSDQGVGMSPEEVAQLFQRYQRVDRDAIKGIRGTGLGLYLVRGLVEAHGGRIWAESEPGRGSAFRLCLPKRRAEEGGSRLTGGRS